MLAIATLVALSAVSDDACAADDVDVEFDREALQRRGLDPGLADLFRQAPRFLPGVSDVEFEVNGRVRGRARAVFDARGELRLTTALLQVLQLRVPSALAALPADAAFGLQEAWPQAVVRLQPALQRVQLIVPADAIGDGADRLDARDFESGGHAAVLNYDVSASQTRGFGRRRQSLNAFTETGFNAGGWVVRSRQTFRADEGRRTLRNVDAYAQHSIGSSALLQLGDIAVANPLLPAGFIRGVQLLPETALQASAPGSRALVEGVAAGEARVEIRQNGVLLYSTLVPPGPFALGGFALNSVNADLDVSVHDAAGTHTFVVSSAAFQRASMGVAGSTVSLGQRRRVDQWARPGNEMLLAGSTAARVPGRDAVVSAGALLSERYQALAVGLDQSLHGPFDAVLSLRSTLAEVPSTLPSRHRQRGSRSELRVSGSAGAFSANIGISQRTAGFFDLDEEPLSAGRTDSRVRLQTALGLGWNSPSLGAFRLSHQPRRTFDGEHASRSLVSWSRRLGHGDLRASLELNSGASRRVTQDARTVYVSWSIPLGKAYARTTVRQRGDVMQRTLDTGGPLARGGSWRASVETSAEQRGTRYATGINTNVPFGALSASLTHGGGFSSLGAQLSGGLVAHDAGVTFSNQRVQDTFGVLQVGDVRKVRINTDGGDVWTDRHGRAVLPRVAPYRKSRVEVDMRSVPRDLDLAGGVQVLQVRRGTVSKVAFAATRSRRLLLQVNDGSGAPMTKGLPVLSAGNFLTVVVDGGRVYLSDYKPDVPLQIQLPNGQRCTLRPQLWASPQVTPFYEEGTAACEL